MPERYNIYKVTKTGETYSAEGVSLEEDQKPESTFERVFITYFTTVDAISAWKLFCRSDSICKEPSIEKSPFYRLKECYLALSDKPVKSSIYLVEDSSTIKYYSSREQKI